MTSEKTLNTSKLSIDGTPKGAVNTRHMALPDPADLEWVPLQHACACVMDWGVPLGMRAVFDQFLPNIASQPCPVHKSDSLVVPRPLAPEEIRSLIPGKLWYRLAATEKHQQGRDNRTLALRGNRQHTRRRPMRRVGLI